MDLKNGDTGFGVRRRELDFPVDTTWTQKGRVENVCGNCQLSQPSLMDRTCQLTDTVGGHDDLDVLCWFESIQLV
jgi:hypothetical protein